VVCVATATVLRARSLTRRLDGARAWTDRSPFVDLRSLSGLPVPVVGPAPLALLAAMAAFLRDLGERGSSPSSAAVVGAVEAGAVLAAFATLRAPLGLRALRG
jgi:hypothetical protein